MTNSSKKMAVSRASKTGQFQAPAVKIREGTVETMKVSEKKRSPNHGGVYFKTTEAATSFAGDAAELIGAMRRGTPASVVQELARRVGVSQDGLFAALRLPPSTMKARISKNQPLSASEQDRMYRADRVWSRALEVLEDENSARAWINRRNRSLGGESPLSLLDTEAGYELVLNTLGQIEYGVVS